VSAEGPSASRSAAARNLIWPSLRDAARAFCPPFEVVEERPGGLAVLLRTPDSAEELTLRYRSERGLFLRTYYLVIEAELAGEGPTEAGTLVLSRRKLRWRRPKPLDGERWSEAMSSPDVRAALKPLQVERLDLAWDPAPRRWSLSLKTLCGSVTVTFFPPLATPNPFLRKEAQAVEALVRELRRGAQTRTPA
jgi:hypothetical protein